MKIQGVQLVRRKPKDGVSVLRIDNYYLLTATGDVPSADDAGWTLVASGETAPVPTSAKPYLWHKSITTMSDGTTLTPVIEFGGSLGQNGFDYDLVPSATAILKDAEGNLTPYSVGCTLIRREADGTVTRVGLPAGYTAKYSLDNGTERNYSIDKTVLSKIVVNNDNSVITFLLYYGDVVVERQNINVIIEGAQGLNGRGIQSQDYRFKAVASNTAPTAPASDSEYTSGWYALESAGYSTEKPYLYRCTKTTYIDGNNKTTTEYAVDGPTVWGNTGDTGNGIKSETKLYNMTTSTTEPGDTLWSTWTTLFPFLNPTALYIWECTKTTYTDGTTAFIGKHIIGESSDYVDKGTQYALSDSGTTAPTSDWSTSYTATEGKWLWERTEYKWQKTSHTYSDAKCVGYFAKSGTDGKAGMVMRVTEWQNNSTTIYHNDEDLETSPRYLDIVTVTDSSTGDFTAYQCKLTHLASLAGSVENTKFWTPMNNMSPIYTSLIVADKAVMRLSQTNQINIVNSENKVQGSFGGVEDETNGYPLWMGGETASAAKFKVKYDGTLEATGANISGTVNATAGTIGGFELAQGRIGVDKDSSSDGLGITENYLRFSTSKQKVLIGALNSYGSPYNGYFSLTAADGTTLELHHDIPSADAQYEYSYKPKALEVYGNTFTKGKQAIFENGYIGTAYSNTIQNWFLLTHKYQFDSNSASSLAVNLPSKTDIDSLMSSETVMFDLEIVCGSSMTGEIVIQPDTGNTTTIVRPRHYKVTYNTLTGQYDFSIASAATVSSYTMYAGDHLRLRYSGGVYYMLTDRVETSGFSGSNLK